MPEPKDRQFVNALARGLEILRAFRIGDVALGNQELAERTGLPKPTVSRLTRTLRELDYLSSDPRTGAYALGPGVLTLGAAALAGLAPEPPVSPHLVELSRKTGLVAALLTRDGADVTTLQVHRGGAAVSVSVEVGGVYPLHRSSAGMAMLSAAPEKRRRAALAEIRDAIPRKEFAAFEMEMRRAVAQYAENGFCSAIGRWRSDVNCAASSISVDASGRNFAISLAAPAYAAPEKVWIENYGPMLAETAAAISGARQTMSAAAL